MLILKILATTCGVLILLAVVLMVWLVRRAAAGSRNSYAELSKPVQPIVDALSQKLEPDPALLLRLAQNRNSRRVLFDVLSDAERLDLFPAEFLTWEALTEADLVLWLLHPNELAAVPDEIELAATVPVPEDSSGNLRYFVYRFKTHPPHWAAEDGWTAGVCGPCDITSPADVQSGATFSRFDPFDSATPEQHAARIDELLRNRRPHGFVAPVPTKRADR